MGIVGTVAGVTRGAPWWAAESAKVEIFTEVTDAAGSAKFTTIYPGWYEGRTVHIHFKIRTTTSDGKAFEFTSQLFFDDHLTDQVHANAPYSAKGQRTLRNDGDGIYRKVGDQLLLDAAKAGDGYAATFDIGLQMT